MKTVAAGGSCETRKLRNADCNDRVPTLYFGARGFESTVVFAMLAACAARARHVVAVANFLPSTVADFSSPVSFRYLLHSGKCCRLSSTTKFFAIVPLSFVARGVPAMSPTARMTPHEKRIARDVRDRDKVVFDEDHDPNVHTNTENRLIQLILLIPY